MVSRFSCKYIKLLNIIILNFNQHKFTYKKKTISIKFLVYKISPREQSNVKLITKDNKMFCLT